MTFLLAIITCSIVFTVVSGNPTGPPSSACTTLTPIHPSSTGSGAAPYELTVSPTTYGPGDQITVTISKTGADDFRGIMVQARQAGSSTAVGSFSAPSSGTKLFFCGMTDDTWVHSDRTDKQTVTATWTAPASGGGDLVFHYTIVQKNDNTGSVYFTGLTSDLTFMDATSLAPTMISATATSLAPTTISATGLDKGSQATTTESNAGPVITTESNAGYQRASTVTIAFVFFVFAIFKRIL